ncbi:MAG TPA: carboxymuconolactone decarboxylase family protein [Bryobacteraceae bacterium]|jgi:uncharacterized peroxidase-related enzyme|nr:carboxymuconolactone decarboxylase family protein [Bryobacteraceae bacterium]
MRLAILDHGHSAGTKVLFALIRIASRQPVLDVIKLAKYRPDFLRLQEITHEAMRGPSTWSIADRELMAAFVAKSNQCEWCTRAHSAVAARASQDRDRIAAVLSDLESAPIEDALRATLRMLGRLTREHSVTPDDMRALLASGVSREQIEDALAVCFAFNITARLANAFGFAMPTAAAFESGAKYLLARGYR